MKKLNAFSRFVLYSLLPIVFVYGLTWKLPKLLLWTHIAISIWFMLAMIAAFVEFVSRTAPEPESPVFVELPEVVDPHTVYIPAQQRSSATITLLILAALTAMSSVIGYATRHFTTRNVLVVATIALAISAAIFWYRSIRFRRIIPANPGLTNVEIVSNGVETRFVLGVPKADMPQKEKAKGKPLKRHKGYQKRNERTRSNKTVIAISAVAVLCFLAAIMFPKLALLGMELLFLLITRWAWTKWRECKNPLRPLMFGLFFFVAFLWVATTATFIGLEAKQWQTKTRNATTNLQN